MQDYVEVARGVILKFFDQLQSLVLNVTGFSVPHEILLIVVYSALALLLIVLLLVVRKKNRQHAPQSSNSPEFLLQMLEDLAAEAEAYQELFDSDLIDAKLFADESRQILDLAHTISASMHEMGHRT